MDSAHGQTTVIRSQQRTSTSDTGQMQCSNFKAGLLLRSCGARQYVVRVSDKLHSFVCVMTS